MSRAIAQVVVGLPVLKNFDYAVPAIFQEQIRVGQRVCVEFRSQFIVGIVIGLANESQRDNLKPIKAILDSHPIFTACQLQLAKRIAEYYACSWGEALMLMLPKVLRGKKQFIWQPAKEHQTVENKKQIQVFPGSLLLARGFVSKAIDQQIALGQGVIILVPEIRQVETISSWLKEDYPRVPIASVDRTHKPLKELEAFKSVREGEAKIVVGTRSAVFSCVEDLGLIIIVDEDNSAYKQEPAPFYHAREIAFWRQEMTGCDLAFVTPAPSVELWQVLKSRDKSLLMPADISLAKIQTIDLTNYRPDKRPLISLPLQSYIEQAMKAGEKVLLFLNRKGFSLMTRCRQCAETVKCERCNVPLGYSYSRKLMVCHLCHHAWPVPKICPNCQGAYLQPMGAGIEKLQSEMARIYPQARIAICDRENQTSLAQASMVIATQAVIPFMEQLKFSLIAVLDFDAEINRVNFRSSQRAFGLLIRFRQAAVKQVIVQTKDLNHDALKGAMSKSWEQFYEKELESRQEMHLPPFVHLIAIVLRGTRIATVEKYTQELYEKLKGLNLSQWAEVLSPQPDFTPKLRDRFRFTIMIKAVNVPAEIQNIEKILQALRKRQGIILSIDIDP